MAIEGVDGCGKTTQAKMLVDRLRKNGHEAMYVRPIYLILNLIRVKGTNTNSVSPRMSRASNNKSSTIQRSFMGLLGYPYAVATYIYMKCASRDKIIVCDRYFYQFFFDLFGEFSEKVIRIFPKPDIAFFLDGDLDLFYSRMDNSFDTSVDRDYYTGVLSLYRRISQRYGFIQLDANLDKEEINDMIHTHLTEMWGESYE